MSFVGRWNNVVLVVDAGRTLAEGKSAKRLGVSKSGHTLCVGMGREVATARSGCDREDPEKRKKEEEGSRGCRKWLKLDKRSCN